MANSLREVKARINSTRSTAQITKAMHMVSQSKVKVAEKTYKSYQEFMSYQEKLKKLHILSLHLTVVLQVPIIHQLKKNLKD